MRVTAIKVTGLGGAKMECEGPGGETYQALEFQCDIGRICEVMTGGVFRLSFAYAQPRDRRGVVMECPDSCLQQVHGHKMTAPSPEVLRFAHRVCEPQDLLQGLSALAQGESVLFKTDSDQQVYVVFHDNLVQVYARGSDSV